MRKRGTVAATAVVVALIALLVAVLAGQSPGTERGARAAVSAADSPTNVIGKVSTIHYHNQGTHGPFDVLGFTYGVKSPRDPATGQASGRRQHSPLVITKQLDADSPRLFKALVTNENINQLVLNIYRPNAGNDVYMTYTLTNAHVSQVHHEGFGVPETIPLEEVSFVFQSICVEYTPQNGSSIDSCDDWRVSP